MVVGVQPGVSSRFAWDSVSMPSVQHTSRPRSVTPFTMSTTRSNCPLSFTSRHAAPRQTRKPGRLRPPGNFQNLFLFHQPPRFNAGRVSGRLRAVGAVLRTGPVLMEISLAHLHLAGVVVLPVHGSGPERNSSKGKSWMARISQGPVVAECRVPFRSR